MSLGDLIDRNMPSVFPKWWRVALMFLVAVSVMLLSANTFMNMSMFGETSFDSKAEKLQQAVALSSSGHLWRAVSNDITKLNIKTFTLESPQLIVSYNGVLALVYSGWPETAIELKNLIKDSLVDKLEGLDTVYTKERGGSRFAKVSLGAMCQTCRLSEQQLVRLRSLCRMWSMKLEDTKELLTVRQISLIAYKNRALSLSPYQSWKTQLGVSSSENSIIDSNQLNFVKNVVSEAQEDTMYLEKVNADGNRAPSYLERVSPGLTVVARWEDNREDSEPPWLRNFFKSIHAEFPGMFIQFPPSSLHVTLRGVA